MTLGPNEDSVSTKISICIYPLECFVWGIELLIYSGDVPCSTFVSELIEVPRGFLKFVPTSFGVVDSSWKFVAHGDAREGKWRGNCRIEWVASTLHTTSEHGLSSTTTADAQISAASSRLNWHPRRFKWTRSFRRKTKSGFWACAITFQTQSTLNSPWCLSFSSFPVHNSKAILQFHAL
jgi:hypothetical protein